MRYRYQKKKRKSSLKIIILGGLFFCILAGLSYFLFLSSFFWAEISLVNQDEFASGSIEIAQDNLNQKFWKLIPKKSIFLIPVNQIKTDILNRFAEIEEVVIRKKLPDRLEIELINRQKIGIWCQIEWMINESESELAKIIQCFQIDKNGIIYKETLLISGSMILNIYSVQNQTAKIRDKVALPEILDFIMKIKDRVLLEINNFEIVSVEEIKATTDSGLKIYFNPAYSADSQIRALEIILEDETIDDTILEYIDLKIQKRVYYK